MKLYNNIKIFFCICFISLVGTKTVYGQVAYTDKDSNLFVNDKQLDNLSMKPVFYKDSLLVPTREVFDHLDSYVEYNDAEKMTHILYNGSIISVQADNKIAYIDNVPVEMNVEPKIINNKMLIPLRSVSENLGLEVMWNENLNSAYINEVNDREEIDYNNLLGENNLSNIIEEPKEEIEEEIKENINIPTNENEINIIGIEIPTETEKNVFIINSDNPIEKYTEHKQENKIIIIDFYNSNFKLNKVEKKLENNDYVEKVRIGASTENNLNKTRVVFDLKENKNITTTLSKDKKSLFIDFGENKVYTNKTIESKTCIYDSANSQIVLEKISGGTIEGYSKFDTYNNNKMVYMFNSNLGLENNKYSISNSDINDVEVSTINNKTKISIHFNKFLETKISEDEKNIYIKIMNPNEKYTKVVIIDPGHGGKDPGAIMNDIYEKDIVLSVAKKVLKYFETDTNNNVKIYLTRTNDEFLELDDRAKYSEGLGDLFISLHANSTETITKADGIETYYYDSKDNSVKLNESKEFADILQKNLVKYTGATDRKVKTESHVVTRKNSIPSVLAELGFITNTDEILKLTDEEYQEDLAKAIYISILEYFA